MIRQTKGSSDNLNAGLSDEPFIYIGRAMRRTIYWVAPSALSGSKSLPLALSTMCFLDPYSPKPYLNIPDAYVITAWIAIAYVCTQQTLAQTRASLPLVVRTNFERGSLGAITYQGKDTLIADARHTKRRVGSDDQYYWFNFALAPVTNRTVTVIINKLLGVYRGQRHEIYNDITQPVYSYDKKTWYRIAGGTYAPEKQSFRFTQHFDKDSVFIAYAHPYYLDKVATLKNQIKGNRAIAATVVAKSAENRDITLFTATEPTVKTPKKRAVIMALQHPGEDIAGYVAEGMIRYLASSDSVAQRIRQQWVIHIIPVMNPDGLYRGITRFNAQREDLNSVWLNPTDSLKAAPEVLAVKNWLNGLPKPAVFLDLHSHSQQLAIHDIISTDNIFAAMAQNMTQSGFAIKYVNRGGSDGSSVAYVGKNLQLPAATVELSQSKVNEKYITLDDGLKYGELMIKAIANSF